MNRIGLAFQLFFEILFNADVAQKASKLKALPEPEKEVPRQMAETTDWTPPKEIAEKQDRKGIEALILLATLQREARFLDLIQEDLSEYDDAQIGAAVRDVHRDTKSVLQRMFAIEPIRTEEEGTQVEIANSNSDEIRLVGNVSDQSPTTGTLQHQGWKATKCDLPDYSGTLQQAQILNPAEVEV